MDSMIMSRKDTAQKKSTEELVTELLIQAETQHPFSKNNFVSMDRLVFLWVIGDREASTRELTTLLKTEIHRIVEDERTVWVAGSTTEQITGEKLYQEVYSCINRAAENYLDVEHLFQIIICPIYLPGSMKRMEDGQRIVKSCLMLQRELRKRNRTLEWHPFLMIKDQSVDKNVNQVRWLLATMDDIMEDGRTAHLSCCCPCCLISDINEKGQSISLEQNAKIIVMLTVFQNTRCKNETPVNMVLQPLKRIDEEYFFTARAISICEPVKSILLNRILAVHAKFIRGLFDQEQIFDNWPHPFFKGNCWKEVLSKVPHDGQYQIMTSAIHSLIPVSDQKQYEKNLRNFCKKYYFDPIDKGIRQFRGEWWESFWEEYFIQKAGSLESLDYLEEKGETIIDCVPLLPCAQQNYGMMFSGDLRLQCEYWMREELGKRQRQMAAQVLAPDSEQMAEFREKREQMKDWMESLRNTIQNKIKRMAQTELLFNTGGGASTNPLDEAYRWMDEYCLTAPKKVQEAYMRFQKLFCRYFQKKQCHMEDLAEELLDIYGDVVMGTLESRESYMRDKLSALAGTDMRQLIERLGENWRYPVHLANGFGHDMNQKLFMMGNKDNTMYRKIIEQTYYKIAYKENTLDDRLEIVRVSDRFSEKEIFSEGQEL